MKTLCRDLKYEPGVHCPSCGNERAASLWFTLPSKPRQRVRVQVDDIVALVAGDKYVGARLADGAEHLTEISLRRWLAMFPGRWRQIDRSTAVRWDLVSRVERDLNCVQWVSVGGQRYKVSRRLRVLKGE